MKHPLFEEMGAGYPNALEERNERILIKIEELWDTPAIADYFSDLLIDKRGGRKGFPAEVLADIARLSRFREITTLRQAERREDAIATLAKRGLEVNAQSFLRAVEDGNKELMDLMFRSGVNIHVKDKEGTPPLIISLVKGYTIVAQMLLNAGAEVNAVDKRGLTPLLLACGKPVRGYKSVAETLIRKGAFVNFKDALGYTPLMLALSGGTQDIVELLIERGADLQVKAKDGETAFSLAQKSGNEYLLQLISVKLEELKEQRAKKVQAAKTPKGSGSGQRGKAGGQ